MLIYYASRGEVFLETAVSLHSILCAVSAKSFVMAKYLVFVIVSGLLVCDNIRLVQCTGQCKTHADCKSDYWPYCCGGYFGSEDRTCIRLVRVCIIIAQATVNVATRQSVAALTNVSTRVVRDVSQIQIVI